MKWSYLKFFGFVLFMSLISCHTEVIEPKESILDYSRYKAGNYWVYDWYKISPDGLESYMLTDTLLIEKDSIAGGRTFFIKSGTYLGQKSRITLFDSINSLFTYPERELVFTIDPELKYQKKIGLEDEPVAIGNYQLKNDLELVEVPAGNFSSLNFSGTIESTDENYEYGTRYHHTFYSKNVGLVKMTTLYLLSPDNLEMRLLKFGHNNFKK